MKYKPEYYSTKCKIKIGVCDVLQSEDLGGKYEHKALRHIRLV